jgi:hypothetical protein
MTIGTMMPSKDFILSLLPLVPPCILIIPLLENPLTAFSGPPTFTSQILAYIALAVLGFFLTNRLVPHIKVRALHFREFVMLKGILIFLYQ